MMQFWLKSALGRIRRVRRIRPAAYAGMVVLCVLVAVQASRAQSDDDTGSATEKLIQLLIEKGVVTKDQVGPLLQQAREEAKQTIAARKPRRNAAAKPGAMPAATLPAETPPPPNTVRVQYVPQIVRDQIEKDVREQMMQQAKAEGWASPGQAAPEWTQRVHVYGDIRLRGERILEDRGNGPLVDFNSINSGPGFDINSGDYPPTLNTLEDRTRFRVRARIGIAAQINDWVTADFRIATGNDDSPVSDYQTLGQSGDFTKYALWIDRADLVLRPLYSIDQFKSFTITAGRGPNPYWTTDLVYYDDLNFDGISVSDSYDVNPRLGVFATAGAYTLFNTDLNFSTDNEVKYSSHDKYLFAGQAGVVVKPRDTVTAKLAAGFFAYSNMQGKLSDPCLILQTGYACDTDDTRTQFVQQGNTLFPIRNITLTGTSTAEPEYFGLASRFHVLDLHGRVDYTGQAVPVMLEGEFAKNLAFNKQAIIASGPANNLNGTSYVGGDTAYMMKLVVGKTDVAERWDWNTSITYKYLESDAVLDALTDPNFHLGGTNAKGFILGADVGIAHNMYVAARWYSASQVAGTPYSNDLVQVDVNARF
jgi:hypothetical protein